MELREVIGSRRSIRYLDPDRPVELDKIQRMLEAADIPVLIKLTPNVTDMRPIAQKVKEAGAAGVTAINTVKALLGFDLDTFSPVPSVNGKSPEGGFSGPAIKPIALRFVADVARDVGIPVAGVGGVVTWKDSVEFLLAEYFGIDRSSSTFRR